MAGCMAMGRCMMILSLLGRAHMSMASPIKGDLEDLVALAVGVRAL